MTFGNEPDLDPKWIGCSLDSVFDLVGGPGLVVSRLWPN
jgi:hypothetical protein